MATIIPSGRFRFILTTILSVAAGIIIYLIDSSPGWDDTGITAGLLFLASFVAGIFSGKNGWIWALLIGLWIPVIAIIRTGDFMFLLILGITFAGSYAGIIARKIFFDKTGKK